MLAPAVQFAGQLIRSNELLCTARGSSANHMAATTKADSGEEHLPKFELRIRTERKGDSSNFELGVDGRWCQASCWSESSTAR